MPTNGSEEWMGEKRRHVVAAECVCVCVFVYLCHGMAHRRLGPEMLLLFENTTLLEIASVSFWSLIFSCDIHFFLLFKIYIVDTVCYFW